MARGAVRACFGPLLLITLGMVCACPSHADWNPDAAGDIIGDNGYAYYDRSGEAWSVDSGAWQRAPAWDLPVPVAEVKFIGGVALLTTSDECWWNEYYQG